MKSFELAMAHLRALPPEVQAEVVACIEQKHRASRAERTRALELTSGCLTEEEGEAFSRSVHETCERVDVE